MSTPLSNICFTLRMLAIGTNIVIKSDLLTVLFKIPLGCITKYNAIMGHK